MLETDAPWCGIKQTHAGYKHVKALSNPALFKKREKFEPYYIIKDRNEPSMIQQVFDIVCAIREEDDRKQFAEQIYANTERLFFQK
jgi:TatD DNase family protein